MTVRVSKIIYSLFFFLFFLNISCSTKKNTLINRSFHNLTARFNGYFYAEESIRDGVEKIEKAHKEDYTRILPMFIYGDQEAAKSVIPEMDKAIQKSSTVIQRHSMFIKKKEHVKWIDDNYLTIGKAQFYKKDFFTALETFDYIAKQYKKENIRFDAMLWMIRTYNEQFSFLNAETMLAFLKDEKKLPERLKDDLTELHADYYIKRENYPLAIEFLEKALKLEKKRKHRARYSFILGQLYQKTGDTEKAARSYAKVVKMNPGYEMTFYAQINLARSIETGTRGTKDVKKSLSKMLKEPKNIDFYDQINYALAEIAEKEGNKEEMVNQLKLSVVNSTINTNQKAISYLKLGEYSFSQNAYEAAKTYFDSSVTFLKKDYPGYEGIVTRKENLTKLVENLQVIQLEDSLQSLAKLPEDTRNKKIDELIQKKKQEQEELRLKQEELADQASSGVTLAAAGSSGASTWYFYNPATIGFGISEFQKKWGTRKLEDNWRRANKQSMAGDFSEDPEGKVVKNVEADTATSPMFERETYLENLPFTRNQVDTSNKKIMEAYYNIGTLYREQLSNPAKSIEAFETLLKRFPESELRLSVYYLLYRLYLSVNDKEKSNYYKNIILEKFPDSDYSRIIKDPAYGKEKKTDKVKLDELYAETYEAFKKGYYNEVILNAYKSDSIYGASPLSPKFEYLKAMSIGKTRPEKLEQALEDVVSKYPLDEVRGLAQATLDLIRKTSRPADTLTVKKDIPGYEFNGGVPHQLVWILPKEKLSDGKARLSAFNMEYGAEINFSDRPFDDQRMMVLAGKFVDYEESKDFYLSFFAQTETKNIVKDVPSNQWFMFIISDKNFELFLTRKDPDAYMSFFKKSYEIN